MITTFRVQNYKALRDVTLNLTPIHLLIGPNDSGKTSLLEAMAALCRTVDLEFAKAFFGRWQGSELVTDRNTQSEVELGATCGPEDSLEYELGCRFVPEQRQAKLTHEVVKWSSQEYRLRNDIGNPGESLIRRIFKGDPNSANWTSPPLTGEAAAAVRRQLSGVEFFRWNARLLSLPCALDSNAGFRMQPSGFGLARVLDAILGYARSRFDELESRFKKVFPSVVALRILQTWGFRSQPTDDELIPMLNQQDGKGIFVRFSGQEEDIPAAHLSEGLLLVLAYLAILYSPDPPRLLLVEEPENGIHPERLKEVIGILRELIREQTHTQIVLTSHSPYVVSLFEPEEVTLCRKSVVGDVEIRRLSESKYVREQIDVFNLGEIWTGEGDDRLAEPIPELQEAAR